MPSSPLKKNSGISLVHTKPVVTGWSVVINSCLAKGKGVFPKCLKLARTIPIL